MSASGASAGKGKVGRRHRRGAVVATVAVQRRREGGEASVSGAASTEPVRKEEGDVMRAAGWETRRDARMGRREDAEGGRTRQEEREAAAREVSTGIPGPGIAEKSSGMEEQI